MIIQILGDDSPTLGEIIISKVQDDEPEQKVHYDTELQLELVIIE